MKAVDHHRRYTMFSLGVILLLRCFVVPLSLVGGLQSPLSGSASDNSGRSSLSSESAASWKISPASQSIQDSQRVHDILRKRRTRRGNPTLSLDDEYEDENELHSHHLLQTISANKQIKTRRPRKSSEGTKVSSSSLSKATTNRTPNGIDFPFDVTLQALQAFHHEHSHLVLQRRYLVPETEAYPKVCHGIDLAGTVYNMRWWQQHVKQRPDRVNELRRLGFVWERLQPEWNLILEGLIVYRAIHGNLRVPASFQVPYDDAQWPKACWGIALGTAVYKIRNRGDHLRGNNFWSRRNQLDALGFVWDTGELKFSKFCAALRLYSEIEQGQPSSRQPYPLSSPSSPSVTLKIPSQYVVPRSSRWPNEFWGYRLGERCAQVRQKEVYIKGHPSRLKTLADIGFFVDGGGNDKLRWLKVVHAAALYSQMHRNSLDVPTNFVVPAPPRKIPNSKIGDRDASGNNLFVVGSDEAWPWPEYLWGFPLGQRLRDIRVKGYYLRGKNADARRRQLDALGFYWEPKRGRPRKSKVTTTQSVEQ